MSKPALRLIVTGSRTFTNKDFVWMKLTNTMARVHGLGRNLLIVHGGCPEGPDAFADEWVDFLLSTKASGIDREVHLAKWRRLGPSAGFRRNEEMVRLGAWGVLGFLDQCYKPDCTRPKPHGSHGTSHCLKVARHYKIPIKAWKTKGW